MKSLKHGNVYEFANIIRSVATANKIHQFISIRSIYCIKKKMMDKGKSGGGARGEAVYTTSNITKLSLIYSLMLHNNNINTKIGINQFRSKKKLLP